MIRGDSKFYRLCIVDILPGKATSLMIKRQRTRAVQNDGRYITAESYTAPGSTGGASI